jgi:hypothetical protein
MTYEKEDEKKFPQPNHPKITPFFVAFPPKLSKKTHLPPSSKPHSPKMDATKPESVAPSRTLSVAGGR